MAELEDDRTPGHALYDSHCEGGDWAALDPESRRIWEKTAAGDQDGAAD